MADYSYPLHLAAVMPLAQRKAITRDLHQVLAIAQHLVVAAPVVGALNAHVRLVHHVGAILRRAGLPVVPVTQTLAGTAPAASTLLGQATLQLAQVADRANARALAIDAQDARQALGHIDPHYGRVLALIGLGVEAPTDRPVSPPNPMEPS